MNANKLELFVIKKEETLSNPDRGVVKIIFTRDIVDNTIKKPDHLEFPTGCIWISKGYEEIDQKFKSGELFILNNYTLQNPDTVDYQSGHHDHWSTSHAAKLMDVNHMLPVIKSDLPDVGSGSLPLTQRLPKGAFFILNDTFIYGPFTAEFIDNEAVVSPYSHASLNIPNHNIAKIALQAAEEQGVFLEANISSELPNITGYISSLSHFRQYLQQAWTLVDYISDIQLVTYFSKNKFGKSASTMSRKQAEMLKNAITEQQRKYKLTVNNERLERFTKVIDQYLSGSNTGEELIDQYLKSKEGKEFLHSYLSDNPAIANVHVPELQEKHEQLKAEIHELQIKKQRKDNDIEAAIIKEVAQAKKRIEEIRAQSDAEVQQERSKRLSTLEAKITENEQRLEEVDAQVQHALEKLNISNDIEKLKAEVAYFKRQERDLEIAIKAQEAKLRSPDLPKELTEVKTILDLLQGRTYEKELEKGRYQAPIMVNNKPDNGHQVIQSMIGKFDDNGRSFSFEEMANLLITVQQSFLTVFKGRPGSGKTSTAIRLAKAYGLQRDDYDYNNFLNIPVSRGWVSSRDLIGFYNSLKDCYQPSKAGLYQFLRNNDYSKSEQALRLVLLDEANLSPIEHYWSDFLAMCDHESKNRPLDTGMPNEQRFLKVTPNIRFMATINNDHTTEPLSPRLCDRVPVISMDIQHMPTELSFGSLIFDGAIPFPLLESFFGLPCEYEEGESLMLSGCYDILEASELGYGSPVMISSRKRNAIRAYHEVACRYMERQCAADFALSQHAIPLINGHGKPFKARLEKLREHAEQNNLVRTANLIDDILANGDAYAGSYAFL